MALFSLFRFVEVLVDAPGGGTLTFSTDLPGGVMATRGTGNIPVTSGRQPYRLCLPGTAKGKQYELSVVPAGASAVRLYAAKVYARALGPVPTPWAWYAVPVLETPVEWQPIRLPIPQTSDDWQALKLPVAPTPDVPAWAQIPVDA